MQADFDGAFSNASKQTESEKNCKDFLALTLKRLDTFINSSTENSANFSRGTEPVCEIGNCLDRNMKFQSKPYPTEKFIGNSNYWNLANGNYPNHNRALIGKLADPHPKEEYVNATLALTELQGFPDAPDSSVFNPMQKKTRLAVNYIKEFDIPACNDKNTKFFVIKSNSPQNILISQQHDIWASTKTGNARLSEAFENGKCNVILFFSVCGSGSFCGVSKMMSDIKSKKESKDLWNHKQIWTRDFEVKWLVSKVVPNRCFKHLSNPQNENKPVSQSRDTQVIPFHLGIAVWDIMETYALNN
ncbi:hypothetical protein ACO0RG_004055 [Hanseniaspora osmophila]